MTDLIESTLQGLAGQLPGRTSRPGDDRYAAATTSWAKPVGLMPRMVVHCRTIPDIQLAIAAAPPDHGPTAAVRLATLHRQARSAAPTSRVERSF